MGTRIVNMARGRKSSSYGLFLLLVLAGASFPTPQQEPVQLKAVERATIPLQGYICSLAFTADAKAVAFVSTVAPNISSPGEVRLWHRTQEGERIATLPGTKGTVNALAFTQDGETLATGGSDSADPADPRKWDGVVKLFDATSGKERASLKGHKSSVASLKFSPDGRVLASTTAFKRVNREEIELKLWDLRALKELATIPGQGYEGCVLESTPNGKTLAWGTTGAFSEERRRWEPEIKLVDVATGKELVALKGHIDGLKCMAFSPDGKTLASGGGLPPQLPVYDGITRSMGRKALMERPGQLRLWDVATGKERADLQGHNGCVLSVAFSPDGKMLVSGGAGIPVQAQKYALVLVRRGEAMGSGNRQGASGPQRTPISARYGRIRSIFSGRYHAGFRRRERGKAMGHGDGKGTGRSTR